MFRFGAGLWCAITLGISVPEVMAHQNVQAPQRAPSSDICLTPAELGGLRRRALALPLENLDASLVRVFGLAAKARQIIGNADAGVRHVLAFPETAGGDVVVGVRTADQARLYFLTDSSLKLRMAAKKVDAEYQRIELSQVAPAFPEAMCAWATYFRETESMSPDELETLRRVAANTNPANLDESLLKAFGMAAGLQARQLIGTPEAVSNLRWVLAFPEGRDDILFGVRGPDDEKLYFLTNSRLTLRAAAHKEGGVYKLIPIGDVTENYLAAVRAWAVFSHTFR